MVLVPFARPAKLSAPAFTAACSAEKGSPRRWWRTRKRIFRCAQCSDFSTAPHESMQPGDFGAWAQYAVAGRNLDEMTRRAARTVHFHQPGATLAVEDRCDPVAWSSKAAVRQRRGHIQHSDHILAPMLRAVRAYAGANWLPDRIEVDYPRPVHWQRLEEALGAPIRFDAPKVSLVFQRTLLECPAVRRSPPR